MVDLGQVDEGGTDLDTPLGGLRGVVSWRNKECLKSVSCDLICQSKVWENKETPPPLTIGPKTFFSYSNPGGPANLSCPNIE
jgi:hypothetical protein